MAVGPQASDDPQTGSQTNITAQITLGDVSATSEDAVYKGADDLTIFTDYEIVDKQIWNPQTLMIPVSSPTGFAGASVAFCQMANPTCLRYVSWSARRCAQQPDVPDPTQVSARWVLLRIITAPAVMEVAADGVTPIYRLAGTYIYGLRNPGNSPLSAFQTVQYPNAPYFDDSFATGRNMPASALVPGLIS